MRTINLLECSAVFVVLAIGACAQDVKAGNLKETQIQTPGRSSPPLFQGQQNNQKPEIHWDSATGLVTVTMALQDPNGYFIPNIRRDNFAVYENGVRQPNATVEIEHAPVSLAVLMEWGGRYTALNKALGEEVPRAAQQLLDQLGRQDQAAIWRYGDHAEQFLDFSSSHDTLYLTGVRAPELSEANLYDALLSTLQQLRPVSGRKALVLISTGIDTFSRTTHEDLLNEARHAGTPVYVIDVGPLLHRAAERSLHTGPYAGIDWNRAETDLQDIAKTSGGRIYPVDSTADLSGVYDDIMENLKVRYVVSYRSSSTGGDLNAPRTVRIELVDPKTGQPLQILDAGGKPALSKLTIEDSYAPQTASAGPSLSASAAERNKEQ